MHLSPGLWVSNTARLRSIVEMVARASFQRRREPMDAALWYASECQKRPSKCQKSSSTRSVAQDTAVGEAFLCCCYFVIVLLFLNNVYPLTRYVLARKTRQLAVMIYNT